jgi:hypothetical protein
MSPQSTLIVNASRLNEQSGPETVSSSMSTSQIAEAADTAFSMHKRLDAELSHPSPLEDNPLDQQPFMRQLKKRKNSPSSDVSSRKSFSKNYSATFLSAIFDDIANATGNREDLVPSSGPSPNASFSNTNNNMTCEYQEDDNLGPPSLKKLKSCANGMSRCMSRSPKSFKNLSNAAVTVSTASPGSSTDDLASLMFNSNNPSPVITNDFCDVGQSQSDDAAGIIDRVLDMNITFPHLPVSVSVNSCKPNNLTQTAVQAAQVIETSNINVEGTSPEKDAYGWFVEMDDDDDQARVETIANASQTAESSKLKLSFAAATAPKIVEDDAELEWAKAADTVDDVLGDFF